MNGEKLGIQAYTSTDESSAYFTTSDLNSDWDDSGATTIVLNDSATDINGSGAYYSDGNIYIVSAGYYVLSGELTDGSIIIDSEDSSEIWIKLDGVDVYCSDDAALRVENAEKVYLTLADGSENLLSSGESYSDEAEADGTDGVIFSHDDLTINGSGSLTVSGGSDHGIVANDYLVITGGNISVTAARDGIHVNDGLYITNATITIEAGDEGIDVDEDTGELYIESGQFIISASDDGIHTGSGITILSGTFEISAGDDGIHSDGDISVIDGTIVISQCYEGIEAYNINISGGDITIYATDDGLNATAGTSSSFGNGITNFNKGFGGRGQNNDSSELPDSSEMPDMSEMPGGNNLPDSEGSSESESDTSGVNITLSSNSDSDSTEIPNNTAESDVTDSLTSESSSESLPTITISGGKVTIINQSGQDADGIDSNGSIYITGGEVYISLSGSGSNCALDYGEESGGICKIDGGIVVASGSSSMQEDISDTSTQAVIVYTISASGNSLITLADSSGEVILEYTVPVEFTSVIISCEQLQLTESYTLTVDSSTTEVTLESIITSLTGSAGNSGNDIFNNTPGAGGGGWFNRGNSNDSSTDEDDDSTDLPGDGDFDIGDMPNSPGGNFSFPSDGSSNTPTLPGSSSEDDSTESGENEDNSSASLDSDSTATV